MTVTLDELRALCVPSVRELRVFHHVPARGGGVRITVRPQSAVRIQRLVIPDGIVALFVIHDLRIAGTSQFGGGAIPGDLFAASALDAAMDTAPVAANTDVILDVEYVGDDPEGRVFFGAFIGTVPDGSLTQVPIQSNVPIRPSPQPEIVEVNFDDAHYRFEVRKGQLATLVARTENVLPVAMLEGDAITNYFNPPRVVSLRVEHFPEVPFTVFYVVDEATGQVVLEVGEGMAFSPVVSTQ